MKLPRYRRILKSDYAPEDQEIVDRLGGTINDFFGNILTALDKRITFEENISSTSKTLEVTVDSSGNVVGQAGFNLDVKNTPIKGCVCIRAENLTNSTIYPTGTPFVSFIQQNDYLRITNISNLQPDNRYRLYIIAIN
jgi:hypothetical protein